MQKWNFGLYNSRNWLNIICTIIKIVEERGFTFSAEEVQNYVRTMNENEEFADIELTKLL